MDEIDSILNSFIEQNEKAEDDLIESSVEIFSALQRTHQNGIELDHSLSYPSFDIFKRGIIYSFSKLGDNCYRFDMSKSIAFWRFEKKGNKLDFFNPPSGSFIFIGTTIDDKKITYIVLNDKTILLN